MKSVNEQLKRHIKENIIPAYKSANKAHSIEHIKNVIDYALMLAEELHLNLDIIYTAAAYHDIGILGWGCPNSKANHKHLRKYHHIYSARAVMESNALREFFNITELKIISDACLDHRASNPNQPSSIFGKVIADADRLDGFELDVLFQRCLDYENFKYPNKEIDEIEDDIFAHINDKYSFDGYAFDSIYLKITKMKFEEQIQRVKEVSSSRSLFEREFAKWFKDKSFKFS